MPAQLPDIIIIDHAKLDLYSNPLELLWTTLGKKRPAFCPIESCQRGYIATWEILEQQLYIRNLDANVEQSSLFFQKKIKRYTLKMLLSRLRMKDGKASWFSGKLRVPLGNMTYFDDHHYDSRFEKDMIITVHRGIVTKMVTLDYANQLLVVN